MTKKVSKKTPNTRAPAPVTSHGIDHGHDARVDEQSEYDATHLEEPSQWVRPSSLEAPPAREGMTQRWVRHSLRGEADPKNLNRQYREGWRFRDPATLPEDWQIFAVHANKKEGYVQVDDLVLMEIPTKTLEQRREAIRRNTEMQMNAVNHDLERSQVAGHPIHQEHRTTVSHPATRVQPTVADNE